jgi:hypothetical protein
MVIDREKGKLQFMINGKNYGTAFKGKKLRTIKLFPGVTLLGDAHVTFSER